MSDNETNTNRIESFDSLSNIPDKLIEDSEMLFVAFGKWWVVWAGEPTGRGDEYHMDMEASEFDIHVAPDGFVGRNPDTGEVYKSKDGLNFERVSGETAGNGITNGE